MRMKLKRRKRETAAAAVASSRLIRRKMLFKSSSSLLQVIFVFLAASGLLSSSSGAVVRPTVFSGLNSTPEVAPAAAGQQQPSSHHQSQQHNHAMPISDGPQTPSTKINPHKSRFCTSATGARLDAPLGLQSSRIDDLALSASSYSNEQVGPHLARLNLDIAGGAWCPMKPISVSNFGKEWIQAKLNRSFVVTAIETQGRFGMGNGKEFVPSFQVEYSRNGGLSWHKWKDFRGSSLLRANDDVNSAVKNELSPPIVGANVIRILPFSQHLRTVCLRFELHGCLYDEGAPISYETSDGVVEPRWGHLIDYTYDGLRHAGYLSKGLGQLVDGVKGADNFSHNMGFEWVGWKSMNGDVVLEFSFKTVRNFTGALFHSNNLFSSGVEVFQAVDVHYGIDVPLSVEALRDSVAEQRRRDALLRRPQQAQPTGGSLEEVDLNANTLWSSEINSIEYEPDKKVENSRPVTVHLKHRLANKLRFVLKFASKWILVSEVEFLSHPVELLSLSSANDQQTPALVMALAPAKTYDEYIAILREHQLRRIATNAFLQSQSSGSISEIFPPSSFANNDQQDQQQQTGDVVSTLSMDYYASSTRDPLAGRPVSGPAIPIPASNNNNNNNIWQGSTSADFARPATNPALSQLLPFVPIQQNSEQFQPTEFKQKQDQMVERRTIGLATVISFVLVTILVIIALLFAISSYRLRQPKLGSPKLAHRQLSYGAQSGKSLLSSVFASPGNQQFQANSQNTDYNAIFCPNTVEPESRRAANTLKRFATLTSGQNKSALLANQAAPQAHQLLVSMKDEHQTAVNTQLIVGLNRANPFAQQQIYNNSSNMNCSNQTYATLYSTSMSMGSSSTNGHKGDYADYAVPDVAPNMIAPLVPHNSTANHHHHQHQLQHMNLIRGRNW